MHPGLALGPAGEVGRVVPALGPQDVKVDIAIAHVAKGTDAAAGGEGGHGPAGLTQEAGDLADRHRDVVLPGRPFGLLGGGLVLPQGPEGGGLGLARCDDGFADDARLGRLGQQGLHEVAGPGRIRGGDLQENAPGRSAGQGVPLAGDIAEGELDTLAGHQLEGLQAGVGGPPGPGQKVEGIVRAVQADHGHRPAGGPREELDAGGGDDAQGALGTGQEPLEVVAGIVLAQAAEATPDLAVGEHGLQAQDKVPGRAKAENSDAAGVGRDDAAQGGRPF